MEKVTQADLAGPARRLRSDVIAWSRAIRHKGKPVSHSGYEPSDGMLRIAWVTDVAFGGNHHVDTPVRLEDGEGWVMAVFRLHSIAIFDFNEMTRIVVAAHEAAVHVEVRVGGFRQLELWMWPRKRSGGMATRHPALEDGIAGARESRWYTCPVPVPEASDG